MMRIKGRPGWIRVRIKASSKGSECNILETEFDPEVYEHVDEPKVEVIDTSSDFKPSAKSIALCDALGVAVSDALDLFEGSTQKEFQSFVEALASDGSEVAPTENQLGTYGEE